MKFSYTVHLTPSTFFFLSLSLHSLLLGWLMWPSSQPSFEAPLLSVSVVEVGKNLPSDDAEITPLNALPSRRKDFSPDATASSSTTSQRVKNAAQPSDDDASPTLVHEPPQQASSLSAYSSGSPSYVSGSSQRHSTSQGSYEQLLASWLNHYKRYPERARQAGEEGIVAIKILIDRQGHVKRSEIIQSSGSVTLDTGAKKMVEYADPFPHIPDTYAGTELEFIAPVKFQLSE